MKILNAQQIKEVDQCSIQKQKISSWELMERASAVFVDALCRYLTSSTKVHIFCGKGNNGGDGLAIARMLADRHFSVSVFIVQHTNKASEDFLINYEKIKTHSRIDCRKEVFQYADIDGEIKDDVICIDALLGSGINKAASGLLEACICHINKRYKTIYSVDMPSGLFIDKENGPHDAVVKSTRTFTFQLPKLSFFFPENAKFVGDWEVLDIGLSEECIQQHTTSYFTIDSSFVASLYIPRKKVSAKWDYGHCLVIAGSWAMPGAAVMCVGSALRSGCGLVTIHSVEKVVDKVSQYYPECLLSVESNSTNIQKIPGNIKRYTSIAFGCGMGYTEDTHMALHTLLQTAEEQKLIIDADGLNVLAQHPEWIDQLPPYRTILTPHIKEFDRLFGNHSTHYQRLQTAIQVAIRKKIVVVLKSAYTAVILPSGYVYFATLANSGLAKGGSGDVLTGLIAGLCARGYQIENAALLAVYLHAYAGLMAAQHTHSECVLPTDVIAFLPHAFKLVENA